MVQKYINIIQNQKILARNKFFEKELIKRPSQNILNENFNTNIFQNKLLKFLIANNISFRVTQSSFFRKLLLYLRKYIYMFNNLLIFYNS